MSSLFERINDNIGPYVFDTYSQSAVEYTVATFNDGTSVTGIKLKETLTELTLNVTDNNGNTVNFGKDGNNLFITSGSKFLVFSGSCLYLFDIFILLLLFPLTSQIPL
mgnify:CR=1 FL=1